MSVSFPLLCLLVILAVSTVSIVRWIAEKVGPLSGKMKPAGVLKRKQASVIGIILFLGFTRIALLGIRGVPDPVIADEFSYLFMADTFAHGRLANPTHPYWKHFESLFILSQPTYSSVYPPAQGLILAASKLITGIPWSGVWFSSAVMCGSFCWMLQAWVPSRWALLGAMLAALQFGLDSYWMNSYWGGAHAATGGALVLGAFRRLQLRDTLRDSLLLGVGLSILANSRPYEGLALAASLFLPFFIQRKQTRRQFVFGRAVLPALLIMFMVASAMLYYFYRVTGDPFHSPAQVYIQQHAVVPMFVWQKLRPHPLESNPAIRDAMLSFLPDFDRYSSAAGIAQVTAHKVLAIATFFLGPLTFIPLCTLPWLVLDRKMRPLLFCTATGLFAIALTVPFELHYMAPFAAAIVCLLVQSLRRLWILRRFGVPIGYYLVPACPVLLMSLLVIEVTHPSPPSPLAERAKAIVRLESLGGQHLVFVRYGPVHMLSNDWIHNSPDIDRQQIVWARERTPEEDLALTRYFSGRRVWLVDADRPSSLLERKRE